METTAESQKTGPTRQVRLEFGRCVLPAGDVRALRPGSVVELDVPADGEAGMVVEGRTAAVGRLMTVGGKLALRVSARPGGGPEDAAEGADAEKADGTA